MSSKQPESKGSTTVCRIGSLWRHLAGHPGPAGRPGLPGRSAVRCPATLHPDRVQQLAGGARPGDASRSRGICREPAWRWPDGLAAALPCLLWVPILIFGAAGRLRIVDEGICVRRFMHASGALTGLRPELNRFPDGAIDGVFMIVVDRWRHCYQSTTIMGRRPGEEY
jgi:hypothetical protein